MKNLSSHRFFVFQGVLSPNVEYIFIHSHSSLERIARKANAVVEDWLSSMNILRGITITDFSIYGFPEYSRSVFEKNWITEYIK